MEKNIHDNEKAELRSHLEKSIKTIAKGAGIVFAGIIIGHILGMVNQILLGRFLGVEAYGQFNLALSVVMIGKAFAVFGIPGGLSRFIPFYLEKKQRNTVRGTIRFSIGFVLTTSVILAAVAFLFSDRISIDIFHEEKLQPVLKYFVLGIPLVVLPGVLESIIRAFKAMKYKFYIHDIGMKIVKITVFIFFILLGYELLGAIAAYFAAMSFVIVASIIVIRKKLFPVREPYKRVAIAKRLLSFSWPLGLTGLTFLFVSKTDVILLGYYLDAKDIGIYMPALVIAQLLTFVSVSFEFIFLPVVSEFFARESMSHLASLFKSVSKWMVLLILPMLLYVVIFPKEIIRLLYGTEYTGGYQALIILVLGIAIGSSTSLAGNILVGGGHTMLNLASELIAAATNVSLNIILIPLYGILGAAIGTASSYLIRGIAFLLLSFKTTKMHPFNKDYLKILSAGVLSLAIVFFLKTEMTAFLGWPVVMIVLGFALLFIYAGLLLPTRFMDENDILILEAIETRLGKKIKFIRRFL
jgi:O-antigen/teichoic acid export membrane protein